VTRSAELNWIVLLLACLLFAGCAAKGPAGDPPQDNPAGNGNTADNTGANGQDDASLTDSERHVKELIAKLADESFEARETAMVELIALGKDALEMVNTEMFTTRDSDVKLRCKEIIRRVVAASEEPEWRTNLKRQLDHTLVSPDFTDALLSDVFEFLRQSGNVDIMLDPRVSEKASETITVNSRNITLAQALGLCLTLASLRYELLDGVVVVGTDETLRSWPGDPIVAFTPKEAWEKAITAKLSLPIDVTFEDATVKEIVEQVRNVLEINIVCDLSLDAKKAGADFEKRMAFRVSEIPAFQALNLVLKPHGLSYCLRDGVLFVSMRKLIEKQPKR
jgi:predicted small lipoprotein YifL